jgi:hypothetical protein
MRGCERCHDEEQENRAKRPRRADPVAIFRARDRRISATGAIDMPCITSMLDHYVRKLVLIWELLGRKFKEDEVTKLRELILRGM